VKRDLEFVSHGKLQYSEAVIQCRVQ